MLKMPRRRGAPVALFLTLIAGAITLTGIPGSFASDPGDTRKLSQSGKSNKTKKASSKRKSRKGSAKDFEMKEVPADEKLEKKLIAGLPDKIREGVKVKRTLHYSILYDTSEEDVAVFEHAIERTYRSCAKFCIKLGIDIHPPRKKLISYFFNNFDDYSAFGGTITGSGKLSPNLLGFYTPSTNHTYFYNFRNTPAFKDARDKAVAQLEQLGEQARNSKDSGQRKSLQEQMGKARRVINSRNSFGGGVTEETLQHEVSHQVLFNIGFHNKKNPGANPRWFAEGMAQLFEPISNHKGGNMGIVNTDKALLFNQLSETNHLIPPATFIQDAGPFQRSDAGNLAYPESWGFAHYITRTQRAGLKKYVNLILKRSKDYKSNPEDEVKDFETCFGKIDQKWEKKWKVWMKNVR